MYVIYLNKYYLDYSHPPGELVIPPLCPVHLFKASWRPKQCRPDFFCLPNSEEMWLCWICQRSCSQMQQPSQSEARWRVCAYTQKCALARLVWGRSSVLQQDWAKTTLFLFFPSFPSMHSLSKNWLWVPKKSGTESENLGQKQHIKYLRWDTSSTYLTKNCLFLCL